MDCIITEESFDWFTACWQDNNDGLNWDNFFVLPPWLRVWQQNFAPEARLYFLAGRQEDRVIGIAPLMLTGQTASIIGNPDVCDYADLIVAADISGACCYDNLPDINDRNCSFYGPTCNTSEEIYKRFCFDVLNENGESRNLWLAKPCQNVSNVSLCQISLDGKNSDDYSVVQDSALTREASWKDVREIKFFVHKKGFDLDRECSNGPVAWDKNQEQEI